MATTSRPVTVDTLFEHLPAAAQKFYRHADINADLLALSLAENTNCSHMLTQVAGLALIYPLFRIRYLAANEMAVALVDGEYKLVVGPGLRWNVGYNDRMFEKRPIGSSVLHGSIKIIRVDAGFLKIVTDIRTGCPILLGPGMHYFNDVNISLPEDVMEIDMNFRGESALRTFCKGSFTFIFVRTGEAAVICRHDGSIDVLSHGLHFIEAPTCFRTFVSVQQEHFRFGSCEKGRPTFLTSDNVELHVEATLFYRLMHVAQAFTTSISNKTDLHETLHSQAMSTLMMIIRSENFSNMGRRTAHDVHGAEEEERERRTMQQGRRASTGGVGGAGDGEVKSSFDSSLVLGGTSLPLAVVAEMGPAIGSMDTASGTAASEVVAKIGRGFQNIVADAEPIFKNSMQQRFGDQFGFKIDSLRIENITFADKVLQKHVSDFAVSFTKLSAQQATIEGERQVQRATAEREAETQQIRAEADARVKLIAVKSEMDAKRLEAAAEAEATRIRTEADVGAIQARGAAEADVLRKIGEAEAEILRTKGDVPNAALSMVLEAQVKAMQGTDKIIYCDAPQMLLQQVGDIMKGVHGAQAAASGVMKPPLAPSR